MTKVEFTMGMARLIKMYGPEAYPQERVEIVFRKLEALTANEWGTVVTEVIANQRFAPVVDKIIEIAEPQLRVARKREAAEQQAALATAECPCCGNIGTISAIYKKHPSSSSYAFGCPIESCAARRTKAMNVLRWSEQHETEFEPVFFSTNKTPHDIWVQGFGEPQSSRKNLKWQNLVDGLRHGRLKLEEDEDVSTG